MKKILPCLWFDTQAEEAARFYATVFKNSKIGKNAHYSETLEEVSGKKAGRQAATFPCRHLGFQPCDNRAIAFLRAVLMVTLDSASRRPDDRDALRQNLHC